MKIGFMREEGGFTTPAVAVALLLVFALLSICARGLVVGTRSAQVQYVADAGALAADSAVAEYVTAAQVADALLLTCSLAAVAVFAASAVASFIPGAEPAAVQLAELGHKVLDLRGRMARSANSGLERVQKALPALCAVRAAECVQANAQASGISYTGIALAFPSQGVSLNVPDASETESALEEVESAEKGVQEQSGRRAQAQRALDDAKERAWRADCGGTGMNMRERAGHLAGLSGAENPKYSSPDAWSFTVPLERAKAYYRARLAAEPGATASGTPEMVAESVARKAFYRYALAEVSKGRVYGSPTTGERPRLRALARNTDQIRETPLYGERVYPVSSKNGRLTLHAYTGCPGYAFGTPAGSSSVKAAEAGEVGLCDTCKFSVKTLGRVPAASTSIGNGFEYYYRAVVEAARDYDESRRESEETTRSLRNSGEKIAQSLKSALKSLAGTRIDPQPPGRYGCVCIVFAPRHQLDHLPFLEEQGAIPVRMAISGATLAPDVTSDQGTVIGDVAQGLIPDAAGAPFLLRSLLSGWGGMLDAYGNGVEGASDLMGELASSVPVVGDDLSTWAQSKFQDAFESVGLQPADLTAYKPVLVDTSRILERDEGAAGSALRAMKRAALVAGSVDGGDFRRVVDLVGECPELQGILDEKGLVLMKVPFSALGIPMTGIEVSVPAPLDLAELFGRAVSAMRVLGAG